MKYVRYMYDISSFHFTSCNLPRISKLVYRWTWSYSFTLISTVFIFNFFFSVHMAEALSSLDLVRSVFYISIWSKVIFEFMKNVDCNSGSQPDSVR